MSRADRRVIKGGHHLQPHIAESQVALHVHASLATPQIVAKTSGRQLQCLCRRLSASGSAEIRDAPEGLGVHVEVDPGVRPAHP